MTNSAAAHYSIFNDGSFKVNNTSNNNHTGTIGTNLFTIKANGDVGIGTNIPSHKLDVNGNIKCNSTFIGNVGHSGYAGFSHSSSATTTGYALLQHSNGTTYLNCESNKGIYFRTANTTYMEMSPSNGDLLTVHGGGRFHDELFFAGGGNTNSDDRIKK